MPLAVISGQGQGPMRCGLRASLEARKGVCIANAQQTLKETEEPVRVLRGGGGWAPCAVTTDTTGTQPVTSASPHRHCDRGHGGQTLCFYKMEGAELGHLQLLTSQKFCEHLALCVVSSSVSTSCWEKQQQLGLLQEASGAADCPGRSLVGMGLLLVPARRVCSCSSHGL